VGRRHGGISSAEEGDGGAWQMEAARGGRRRREARGRASGAREGSFSGGW
jgi:hypothetical protein